MNGEALAPIPFGGIYLPLECRPGFNVVKFFFVMYEVK